MAESALINATLFIPPSLRAFIEPFNSSEALKAHYCLSFDKPNITDYWLRADEILNIHVWFKPNRYNKQFILSDNIKSEISDIFIRMLSLLLSNIDDTVMRATEWLITNKLGGSFNYTAVHKRFMEGECPKFLQRISPSTDYSPNELPMNHPSWNDLLMNKSHPLCEMSIDFIEATQRLNHRENQTIYIAHDGYHTLDKLIQFRNVVTSDSLDFDLFPTLRKLESRILVDMFLAINGDLFIMNPRSTYSWCILVLRELLDLKTVPIVKHRDLYFKSDKDYEDDWGNKRWVGPTDIIDAVQKMQNGL